MGTIESDSTSNEINILLEDYKARRDEIHQTLDSAFATSNISLAGIAAVLSVASFIYEAQLTGFFAIFSILFCAISWTQLRLIIQVFHLSNHIINVISPRLKTLLRRTDGKKKIDDYSWIFSWELNGRKVTHGTNFWFIPIEAARYGLPLLAAITSFFAFTLSINISGFVNEVNILLLVSNVICILFSIAVVFKVRFMLRSQK